MQDEHFALWQRCGAFVADVCAGRDASHGLAHMQRVTEQAVLLYCMDATTRTAAGAMTLTAEHDHDAMTRWATLYGIVLVGMLHDVADHKYDTHDQAAEQLQTRLHAFVQREVDTLCAHASAAVLCSDGAGDPVAHCAVTTSSSCPHDVRQATAAAVLTCLHAISFSAERRRGMRWFARELSPLWLRVRDCVSDADKLEAIGEDGLLRCYEYQCARERDAALARRRAARNDTDTSSNKSNNNDGDNSTDGAHTATSSSLLRSLEAALLRDVVAHCEEKLCVLSSQYMVTRAGRFLAAPRDDAMRALLQRWQHDGSGALPPVTLYWPEVVHEYVA